VLIWAMEKNPRLKPKVKAVVDSVMNEMWVSVVSVWEMLIKKKLGKLRVPGEIKRDLLKAGFKILALNIDQVLAVDNLPLLHKDPFDRMLVAQAQAEEMTLITADAKLAKYEVKCLENS